MYIIHKEDKKRIIEAVDNIRAASVWLDPCGHEGRRAINTVSAGVAETLTILNGLKTADDHLSMVVDKIFAGKKCPLADDAK